MMSYLHKEQHFIGWEVREDHVSSLPGGLNNFSPTKGVKKYLKMKCINCWTMYT